MYTRPGTGSGFNDGSSYASSSHYSGLPPGHGLPHGLPVTLSAHSSISGANRVVDALAMARRAAAAVAGAGAGLRQHVDAVGLRVGVAAGRAAAPCFVTSHYHPPLFHPVDAGSQFVLG